MKVFLTVDTEVWPAARNWPHVPLPPSERCDREVECYLWGGEGESRLGLPFQLEALQRHGLKATFFVDPLFSLAIGQDRLARAVHVIRESGQEVALHLHPEWLTDQRIPAGAPPFRGPLLCEYGEDEQVALLEHGVQLLKAAGAPRPRAFRAGSFAADASTLRALRAVDIGIDTSFNACSEHSFRSFGRRNELRTPEVIEDLMEFPVTTFRDGSPYGSRPLHIAACTFAEMRNALDQAFERQWPCVVIVMHSFEFVRTDRLEKQGATVGPRRLVAARFERLCRYLSAERDRLVTSHFSDACAADVPAQQPADALESSRLRTLGRYVAQASSVFY